MQQGLICAMCGDGGNDSGAILPGEQGQGRRVRKQRGEYVRGKVGGKPWSHLRTQQSSEGSTGVGGRSAPLGLVRLARLGR